MPVVLLPGATTPTILPSTRLKEAVEGGQRVVLPDFDCAISKTCRYRTDEAGGTDTVYLVEPINADYVESGVMDPSADNSEMAEEFATFEEALESATAE